MVYFHDRIIRRTSCPQHLLLHQSKTKLQHIIIHLFLLISRRENQCQLYFPHVSLPCQSADKTSTGEGESLYVSHSTMNGTCLVYWCRYIMLLGGDALFRSLYYWRMEWRVKNEVHRKIKYKIICLLKFIFLKHKAEFYCPRFTLSQ